MTNHYKMAMAQATAATKQLVEGQTIIDQNALKRYLDNEHLGKQMGVYFVQMCRLRDSMGRKHLTELLDKTRTERIKRRKRKETRNDQRANRDRAGGGRVRGNGNG